MKEGITANGVQGIFKVQPVILIQPSKDSITQDRNSKHQSHDNRKNFACVLDEVCQEEQDNVNLYVETYDKRAREVLYIYNHVRCFDFKQ